MRTEATKKLFTADEYHQMSAAGIFPEDDRVELIEGEIMEMGLAGDRHSACVNRANALFSTLLAGKTIISVENPVRLSNYTEPLPDIVLLKPHADYYSAKHLSAEDTFLVIEIADNSLKYDRNCKLPLYAKSGVPEVWIEDLQRNFILVYREPLADTYASFLTLRRGDSVSPLAFPSVVINVNDLLD